MCLITNAQKIAIRLFFANINDNESECYSHLYECDRPYETYVDDHFIGKPFQPWQPFELRSVADMQELVEDLINDIVTTMNNDPDTADENTADYHEDAAESSPECPECHSTNLNKKGVERGKQRYKCKECGKHFYEK